MLNATDPNQGNSKPSNLDNLKLFLSRFSLKKIVGIGFILVLLVVIGIGVMIFLKNKSNSLPSSEQLFLSPLSNPLQGNKTNSLNSGLVFGAGVMIQQGKQLCQLVQEYGSKFSWLTLSWARIQPANKNQWVWKQFDNWVDAYRSCGQEVAIHIHSDAQWAIQPVPPENKKGPHTASMPAKNMQDYYNFIYKVAKHYKGKITRYSIENEAHAEQNWGGTPEEYIAELQTAYKAIKAADPQAIVEDAAMSHEGLGYLTAIWLYQKGQVQPAVDFANSYVTHYYRGLTQPPVIDAKTIADWLTKPGIQKTIKWENLLFQNQKYYDRMQIHNGAPWQNLQTVLDYLHTNLKAQGDDKNLELWEAWYSWTGAPGNGFDPNIQANDLVKQMVIAFGGKAVLYNYWTFTDFALGEGHVGLLDKEGNPRPAATSFKITSEKLTGSTSVQKLNLGDNLYAYKFTKNSRDIYVVWSLAKTKVSLPLKGTLTITDVLGKTTKVDADDFFVDTSPVFIELYKR